MNKLTDFMIKTQRDWYRLPRRVATTLIVLAISQVLVITLGVSKLLKFLQ